MPLLGLTTTHLLLQKILSYMSGQQECQLFHPKQFHHRLLLADITFLGILPTRPLTQNASSKKSPRHRHGLFKARPFRQQTIMLG